MLKTTAVVKTVYGGTYMKRLCRHFSHKLDVQVDDKEAQIAFPFGDCRIHTSAEQMVFEVSLRDASEVDRAEDVVARHLLRMAHKDEPIVLWSRS